VRVVDFAFGTIAVVLSVVALATTSARKKDVRLQPPK
jgi:hypothetical protein